MSNALRAPTDILYVIAADQEYGPELRRRIDPAVVGVGPVEAAIGSALALHQLIAVERTPRLVVSLGSAGSRRRDVGSLWQVSTVSERDIDASRLGFPKGVTPFADHPAEIPLETPFGAVPSATLSTGGKMLGDGDYDGITADLADMETFAVVRSCQRLGVPVAGLRVVSDGPGSLAGVKDWEDMLRVVDRRLAEALDGLPESESAEWAEGNPVP